MKITAVDVQKELETIARPRIELLHYLVDLGVVPRAQRLAKLEAVRTAIAACRDTKRALPPELSSIVTPLLTERGKLHSVERTTRSGKWRDRYGHEIEPVATRERLKPGHFIVSFTMRPEDQLDHLIDLSEVPEEHRDEAFTLVKQLMKKTRVQRGNLPSHLQNTLLPVVQKLIARRKFEEKKKNLEVQENQLRYLLSLERNPKRVERTALKKVKKLVKTKLAAVTKAHLANEQPTTATHFFDIAKRHEEGGKLLIKSRYPEFAALLYSWGQKPLVGAVQLAKDYPNHARELFETAREQLIGAKTLLRHSKPGSMHALNAALLYASAGKHKEGIAAMREIKRPDLVEEIKRLRKHSAQYEAVRRSTAEFRAARLEKLRGK